MVCDRHKLEPVKGYNDCVGCEIEQLRKEVVEANETPRPIGSARTPCSDANIRRALILGAFARVKGYKVGDNPFSETDRKNLAWMQGWVESGDIQP